MIDREDIEGYFIRMGVEAEEVDDNIWVLRSDDDEEPSVVATYAEPVMLLRMKVLDLPQDASDEALAPLFRKLLELNATDLLHGSYGIEEGAVALSDALELETLDFVELRASYESIVFAATSHMKELAELVPVSEKG
jgi:DNA-binding PucR family transcriptional regulator